MMLDDPSATDIDFGVCHSDELFAMFHQPGVNVVKHFSFVADDKAE
jgi:hypothetical protein